MLFIDTSIIFNILLYLFVSVFVVVGRRARVAFVAETSLCAWRRLHLFSARVLLRPSLNAQIHFACGGARVYLRVCVSVRYNTVRQAGRQANRAREQAAACERAGERTVLTLVRFELVRSRCATFMSWQHVELLIGNMWLIARQHTVCSLALASCCVLTWLSNIHSVAKAWQHTQCCFVVLLWQHLLRSLCTWRTFMTLCCA